MVLFPFMSCVCLRYKVTLRKHHLKICEAQEVKRQKSAKPNAVEVLLPSVLQPDCDFDVCSFADL